MKSDKIEFVIADAPDLDFSLTQEAWLNDQLVAVVRNQNGKWNVIFFPVDKYCEISWEHLSEIYHTFSRFIKETETLTEVD